MVSPAYSTSPKAPTEFTTRSRPTNTPRSVRALLLSAGNEVRTLLTTAPVRHATYTREYMGWGVFALMAR